MIEVPLQDVQPLDLAEYTPRTITEARWCEAQVKKPTGFGRPNLTDMTFICSRKVGHVGPHVCRNNFGDPVFAWLDDDTSREAIVSTMVEILKECT